MKKYILVIDSGIGGISILRELKHKFPYENFIYVADNLNSPYGNKSKSKLNKIIINLIKTYLKKFDIKLIVFACNTLTACTIKKVREVFSVKVVGTEPNIKYLYENNLSGLVLATDATINNCAILKIYSTNKLKLVGIKQIAKLLDTNFANRRKIVDSLKKQLKNCKEYTNIVLGCTHYNFIKPEIKQALNNENLTFFSSTAGVVKRVEYILTKYNLKSNENFFGETLIFTTKPDEKFLKLLKILSN